jgi:uncharacterized protein
VVPLQLNQSEVANMTEAQNTSIVANAYAAFLRQDIPAVLAAFDENILWKPVTGAAPHVPTAGVRRGVSEVSEFFKIVADTTYFSRFEPQQYIAQGDKVVTIGHYTATTSVGGSLDSDFVMIFTLRNGKVIEFQEFLDSSALNAAFAAAPATV